MLRFVLYSIYLTCYTDDVEKRLRRIFTKRSELLRELSGLLLLMRGSYFERFSVCGRGNCNCHQGERHGPRGYVTVNMAGKQRQFYVPQSQLERIQEGISQYRRLMEIVEEVTNLNLELMREQKLNEPQQ